MKHSATPILEVQRISRRFPGVVALDQVSLKLYSGEILGVIGENGAGKSTLLKILAGIQGPDQGRILIDGIPATIDSVQIAIQNGISLIHQELNLCQNLSIAANIYLGREPRRFGFIDNQTINQLARRAMEKVGMRMGPETLIHSLTIGQQQMVEIAKAISTDARVVIMDEPTSSLSQRESSNLFQIIHSLKKQGVSVIYVSHRLGEVELLADRVEVLRDGKNAGHLEKPKINHPAMVEKMIGRELSRYYSRTENIRNQTTLELRRVRTPANPDCPISFKVQAGEIVGIAGLVGAGRTELLTTLFGITPAVDGRIIVDGKQQRISNSQTAIGLGIGLVPEDRKLQGVILPMSVSANTSLPTLSKLTRYGFIDSRVEQRLAIDMKNRLGTQTPHVQQSVKFLSGGNQQKVVLAKWLASKPRILLMDEPTRGVDVGAKQEIYRLMDELAHSGVAILFVSSDLEEVLGMSDRILVMHEGNISGQLLKDQFSEQAVMTLATGAEVNQPINQAQGSAS